jgi:hypothetical protein
MILGKKFTILTQFPLGIERIKLDKPFKFSTQQTISTQSRLSSSIISEC